MGTMDCVHACFEPRMIRGRNGLTEIDRAYSLWRRPRLEFCSVPWCTCWPSSCCSIWLTGVRQTGKNDAGEQEEGQHRPSGGNVGAVCVDKKLNTVKIEGLPSLRNSVGIPSGGNADRSGVRREEAQHRQIEGGIKKFSSRSFRRKGTNGRIRLRMQRE